MTQAEALAGDLESRFPEDTSVRFSYVPKLHGIFALAHGDASEALRVQQITILRAISP